MLLLRTIDVWDTLLRRTCHPDMVKQIMCRHLLLRSSNVIKRQYLNIDHLLTERFRVEGDLASQGRARAEDDEYTLSEVYEVLLERTTTLSPQSISCLTPELLEAELAVEKRLTYPDPDIEDLLEQHPAEKTLFLSDFYMSAEMIQDILAHHGLAHLFDWGISSADLRLNKRSGNLYRYLHREFSLNPENHLHIGDNLHSDHLIPLGLGVRTIHYQPEKEHLGRLHRETLFRNRDSLFAEIQQRIDNLPIPPGHDLEQRATVSFGLGLRSSVLFVGLALFIAECSLRDRVERLFFFTREGEFFHTVWRAILPSDSLAGLPLPPAETLEVSRLSTFSASLREPTTKEMMRLWNLYSTQSMVAMLASLAIPKQEAEQLLAQHNLVPDEPVVYPWKDPRVISLFDDPRFKELINIRVEKSRYLLLAYLRGKGFDESLSSVGIVDIGWRGTIQDNLAHLCPGTQLHGYYMGLARYLNEQPPNSHKEAFGPNLNQSLEYTSLLDAVSPMEMLCNSPGGSTEGYEFSQGSLHAVALRRIDPEENAIHEDFVAHFQAGVLAAAGVWAEFIDSHAITAQELRPSACATWEFLVHRSPQELCDAYTALSHNEIFGVGQFVQKRIVPTTRMITASFISESHRRDLIAYLKHTQWPIGIWRRQDVSIPRRTILILALFMARGVKRGRMMLLIFRTRTALVRQVLSARRG
jgi:FMN phosphatase YigB (HAD superfamily)